MRLPRSLLPLALFGCVAPGQGDTAADAVPSLGSGSFVAGEEGWSASVPALRIEGRFEGGGARFVDARGGTLTLRTIGWGRDGALAPLAEGALHADADHRLVFAGAGAREWWRSLDGGFAQGFTLEAAPVGEGPVVLDVHVDGAAVFPWASGEGADLVRDDGSVWRYAGLQAWDADGTPLPAWIEGEPDTLRLRVDDTGARWPVTVDPIVTTAASTFLGSTDSWLGQALAGGDVNGDGYDDLVVSAYKLSTSGAVYVYHGSASGFGATPNATLYPATSGGSTEFGWQVATGDFDADGFAEVLVSEPYRNRGTVYVFEGTSAGVRTTASLLITGTTTSEQKGFGLAVGDWNGDGYDDLVASTPYRDYYGAADVHYGGADGLTSTVGATLTGGAFEYIGYTADNAGDVDGDGYDDFVTGHYQAGDYYGKAYVFGGSSDGLSESRVTTLTGPVEDDFFGREVGGLGDVNGDGYDDLGVGAPSMDIPYDGSGAVYVYYGSSGGVGMTADTTLYGTGYGDQFGWSIARAGDTNGDGYEDPIIGAIYARGLSYANGAAYVTPGSAAGLDTAAMDTVYNGTTPYELFGAAVAGLGDVNGDGLADVAVGHPERSGRAGAAYVYLGTDGTVDDDGDGWFTSGGSSDCDDTDASVHPGATEVCDGVDQDCDGTVDDGVSTVYYEDADGDGYGSATSTRAACSLPEGYVTNSADCDDTSALAHPGGAEVIGSGIDEDCDGTETCQADGDRDGYGTSATVASADGDCTDAGEAVTTNDCDDADATVSPGATETVGDGIDQDCDGGEGCYVDADGDGHGTAARLASADLDCADSGEATVADDCDGAAASVYTGATEVVADGVDQDCDGGDRCYVDADGDDYGADTTQGSIDLDCLDAAEAAVAGDCNDRAPTILPGGVEIAANGVDEDCDGADDCYADVDRDGHGTTTVIAGTTLGCTGPGEATRFDDCDDALASAYPGAAELPGDGVDQDCAGGDLCYVDADGDGQGVDATVASADLACDAPGESSAAGDCDDADPARFVGATEAPASGVDEDCDGLELCWTDADEDGFGADETTASEALDCDAAGVAVLAADCDDTRADVHPGGGEAVADGVDGDCDGFELCWTDADADGHGIATEVTSADVACASDGVSDVDDDCDDTSGARFPGAEESVADGVDQDCDGGDTCYADEDGDGVGGAGTVASANLSCAEAGEAISAADCDDASVSSFPGAAESCNQLDDNCDGYIDEGLSDCDEIKTDGCGCAATPGPEGIAPLLALASLALTRRRRDGERDAPRRADGAPDVTTG